MRLAYPNVHHGHFVGCGRYRAVPQGQEPLDERWHEPHASVRELRDPHTAALALAPELQERTLTMHLQESDDEPQYNYGGDSLGLAYCLAWIAGVRPFQLAIAARPGDLWCTGTLTMHSTSPVLGPVFETGFEVKLTAFVTQSTDQCFVVPATNMLQCAAALRARCTAAGVVTVPLVTRRDRYRVWAALQRGPDKVIITVGGAGLPLLIETLFRPPCRWYQGRRALLALLMGGLVIGGGVWYSCTGPAPLSLQVNYVYRAGGTGPLLPLTADMVLQTGDQYKILFTVDTDAYVYLFQRNPGGKLSQLFPVSTMQERWLNLTNPVRGGQLILLPRSTVGESALAFRLVGAPGAERFYLLASRQPQPEIEAWSTALTQAQQHGHEVRVQELHATLERRLTARPQHTSTTETQRVLPVDWRAGEQFTITEQRLEGLCAVCVYVVEFAHR
jgi:Domain of unknown function (DUF4384)